MLSNWKGIKFTVNNRKIIWKTSEYLETNWFLRSSWVKGTKYEFQKHFVLNENTIYQNLWDVANVMLRGKFTKYLH